MSQASVENLRATIDRMERRLFASDDATVLRLIDAYRGLVPRFESDLRFERDILLSRGGALMLVQAIAPS